MTQHVADWINRVGMILNFFSFWFAAPWFIGEAQLKLFEQHLGAVLRKRHKRSVIDWVFVGIVIVALSILDVWVVKFLDTHTSFWLNMLLRGVGILIIFLPVTKQIAIATLRLIVARLSKQGNEKNRLLVIAGILFTLGFILQFVATFPTEK